MTIHVIQWLKNLVKLLPTVSWKAGYMPNKFVPLKKDAGKQDISQDISVGFCWLHLTRCYKRRCQHRISWIPSRS